MHPPCADFEPLEQGWHDPKTESVSGEQNGFACSHPCQHHEASECSTVCLILMLSITSMLQSGMWSAVGPFASAIKDWYGGGEVNLAMLAYWGPLGYILNLLPAGQMFNDKPVICAGLLAGALLVAGGFAQLFSALVAAKVSRALGLLVLHGGTAMIGVAAPLAIAGAPLASMQVPHRRMRIMTMAVSLLGNAAGPAVVYFVAANVGSNSVFWWQGCQLLLVCGWLTCLRKFSKEKCSQGLACCHCGTGRAQGHRGDQDTLLSCSEPGRESSQRATTTTASTVMDSMRPFPEWKGGYYLLAMAFTCDFGFFGAWGALLWPNLDSFVKGSNDGLSARWYLPPDAEGAAGRLTMWTTCAGCVGMVLISACAATMSTTPEEQAQDVSGIAHSDAGGMSSNAGDHACEGACNGGSDARLRLFCCCTLLLGAGCFATFAFTGSELWCLVSAALVNGSLPMVVCLALEDTPASSAGMWAVGLFGLTHLAAAGYQCLFIAVSLISTQFLEWFFSSRTLAALASVVFGLLAALLTFKSVGRFRNCKRQAGSGSTDEERMDTRLDDSSNTAKQPLRSDQEG